MKFLPVCLLASLGANLAGAALLLWRPSATRAFFRDAFVANPPVPAARPTSQPITPRAAQPPVQNEAAPLAGINWASLQTADYATVMARLADLGFPPDTVRTFMAVLVMKHYEERKRALRTHGDPAEYWRNPHRTADPQEQTAARELDREKNKTVRDLLGGDFDFDDSAAAQRRRFGNLSEEKIAGLKKIFSDYSDLEEQLFADGSDRGSSANRARSALLAKEKRADLERLLTPDELLDYDLRNSNGAHRLRSKFGAFPATEAEFRALYPTFKSAADAETSAQAGSARLPTADARRTRETAERQLDAELRRVLGDARYAALQEANDHSLQQTRSLATTLNLPPASTAELIAVQKELQPRLAAVERDRDLTPNQRDAQLSAIGTEARNRLTRVLGAEGFETYKRRAGGWLGASLNRTAPTPTPAP